MNRRVFVLALGASLFAPRFPIQAQQPGRIPRLGFLATGSASDPRFLSELDTFRQRLRGLGYVEGKNINIEYRYAEGKADRLPELFEELVRLKVDILLVRDSTATWVVKKSTTTIPVVFITGSNPVDSGLVASLARPGGNLTGLTLNSPELVEKRLGLLKEAAPKVTRFAFLGPADSAGIRANFDDAQATAKFLRVQFKFVGVKRLNPDFDGAFRGMVKERIGALVVEGPPSFSFHRKRILQLAEKHRLPAIYANKLWANDGGMMSYGASEDEPFRRAAEFVDKILKGTKPADIPVEQPMKYEFVINLQTADKIGLTIPQSLLFRADKVIK